MESILSRDTGTQAEVLVDGVGDAGTEKERAREKRMKLSCDPCGYPVLLCVNTRVVHISLIFTMIPRNRDSPQFLVRKLSLRDNVS